MLKEQQQQLSKDIKDLLCNASHFISRNDLQHAVRHMDVLLTAANKGYFTAEDCREIIVFLYQEDNVQSFHNKLLIENQSDILYRLFDFSIGIAEKYKLEDEAYKLQELTGVLSASGVLVSSARPEAKSRPIQFQTAFNHLHGTLRGRYKKGALLEELLPTIYNINSIEARYHYDLLKEFIVDELKATKQKPNNIAAMRKLFNTVEYVGNKLIACDLTEQAWDLYSVTQDYFADDQDRVYVNRLATISSNIITKPSPPDLSDEAQVQVQDPALSAYLKLVPVRAEWQKYMVELAFAREKFSSETMSVENILELQAEFTVALKELVRLIISDAQNIVGMPPYGPNGHRVRFCLLALGSLANETPNPFSDLEFAFVLEEFAKPTLTQKRNISEYFDRLLRLVQFSVSSIGEYSPAGFHLDKEGHPLCEDRLKGTPQQLIEALQPPIAPSIKDPLTYSVLHAQLLTGDVELFNVFTKLRQSFLHSNSPDPQYSNMRMHELISREFIKFHISDFECFDIRPGFLFDIKKPVYAFLNYIILDLALNYKVAGESYANNYRNAITMLSNQYMLAAKFGQLCNQAMCDIQMLRVRAQQHNNQQLELFYYPLPDDKLKEQHEQMNMLRSVLQSVQESYVKLNVVFAKAANKCDQYLNDQNSVPELLFVKMQQFCFLPNNIHELTNDIVELEEYLNKLSSSADDLTDAQRAVLPLRHQDESLRECRIRLQTEWQQFVHIKDLLLTGTEIADKYLEFGISIPDELVNLLQKLIEQLSTPAQVSSMIEDIAVLEVVIKTQKEKVANWSLAIKLTGQEYWRLYSLFHGVLTPLLWDAKHFVNAKADEKKWLVNPALGMFAKSIEQYHSNTNPISPKELRVSIKSLVYYLALNKAVASDYYQHMTWLDESYYDYYFRVVEEAESKVNDNIVRTSEILTLLRYYPYENGRRAQVDLNDEACWRNLRSLVTISDAPQGVNSVYIESISVQKQSNQPNQPLVAGCLSSLIVDRLPVGFLSVNDDTVRECEFIHGGMVHRLIKNPVNSAITHTANLFSAYLIGDDSLRSELFAWILKKKGEVYKFPVLMITTSEYNLVTLRDLPDYRNIGFDPKSFSLGFFLELILTPHRDAISKNFVRIIDSSVSERKQMPLQLARECCFASPADIKRHDSELDKIQLNINPILLMQPNMQKSINKEAAEELLRLDPGRMICDIFLKEVDQYSGYLRLFGSKGGKDVNRWIEGKVGSGFRPYYLFPGFITHIFNTIVLMQEIIKKQPDIKHMQLLQHIMPTVAYYFELLCQDELPDTLSGFLGHVRTVFNHDVAQVIGYADEHKLQMTRSLSRDTLSLYLDGKRMGQHLEPDEALAELSFLQADGRILSAAIDGMSNGDVTLYMQLILSESRDKVIAALKHKGLNFERSKYSLHIDAIAKKGHKDLDLTDYRLLTNKDLRRILKESPRLRKLNISGCLTLTSVCMQMIAELCPDIVELNISNITLWQNIDIELKATEFPCLQTLCAKNNAGLKRLHIIAPNLQFLYVDNSMSLDSCRVHSRRLIKVTLNGCCALPTKTLIRLVRPSNASLSVLEIKNCSSLDNLELRSKYIMLNYPEQLQDGLISALNSVKLFQINLSGSRCVNEYHLRAIIQYLRATENVVHVVDFSGSFLTFGAEKLLPELMLAGQGVRRLVLDGVKLKQGAVIYLREILARSYVINGISLVAAGVTDNDIISLCPYIAANKFLCDFNLSGNEMTDRGVTALAEALNKNVRSLNLANNAFDIDGLTAIFSFLQDSERCALIDLDLHGNPSTMNQDFYGIQQWTAVVANNRSLTSCIFLADDVFFAEQVIKKSPSSRRSIALNRRSGGVNKRRFIASKNSPSVSSVSGVRAKNKKNDDNSDGLNVNFIHTNKRLCAKLLDAICRNDLDNVKLLVETGVSLMSHNVVGRTALYQAVLDSNDGIIAYLLSQKPNVNVLSTDWGTLFDSAKSQSIYDMLVAYRNRCIRQQQAEVALIRRKSGPRYNFPCFYRTCEFSEEFTTAHKDAIDMRLREESDNTFDLLDPTNHAMDPNIEYKLDREGFAIPYVCMDINPVIFPSTVDHNRGSGFKFGSVKFRAGFFMTFVNFDKAESFLLELARNYQQFSKVTHDFISERTKISDVGLVTLSKIDKEGCREQFKTMFRLIDKPNNIIDGKISVLILIGDSPFVLNITFLIENIPSGVVKNSILQEMNKDVGGDYQTTELLSKWCQFEKGQDNSFAKLSC